MVAAGIPDEVYWRSTPEELTALLEELDKRETRLKREADLRAGLIAAELHNTQPFRRPGARRLRPSDFIREPPKKLSPEEVYKAMSSWAKSVNEGNKA